MKRMLFIKRYFVVGDGWSSWEIQFEVDIIAETTSAYKIRYKNWCGRLVETWKLKDSRENRFEEIKEKELTKEKTEINFPSEPERIKETDVNPKETK